MLILEQRGRYTLVKIGDAPKVYVAFSRAVPVVFIENKSARTNVKGTAFRVPRHSVDRHGNKHADQFLNEHPDWFDVSYYTETLYEFDTRLENAVQQARWDHRYTAGAPEMLRRT